MTVSEQLILQHREYVRKLAREIHRTLPDHAVYDDLVGFGEVGLVEAAERFDATAGVAFTTFAYRRIRGAIFDGIRKMTWLPPAQRKRITQEAGMDEVAETIPPTDPAQDPEAAANAFNDAIQRLGAVFLVSGLPDDEQNVDPEAPQAAPGAAMENRELIEKMRAAVAELPDDQAQIIKSYYFEQKTMAEIGDAQGVNKTTICRKHTRAIQSLAKALAA